MPIIIGIGGGMRNQLPTSGCGLHCERWQWFRTLPTLGAQKPPGRSFGKNLPIPRDKPGTKNPKEKPPCKARVKDRGRQRPAPGWHLPKEKDKFGQVIFLKNLLLMHISMKIQRQGQTEQQMADANETILAGIADAGDYYASAQAQNLLNEYKGYSYQPAIILPGSGQQGLKLPEEVTIQQAEGLQLRAVPNPAKDYTDFHFRLPGGVESARLVIRDLDGKTIASFLIENQTGSIAWSTAKVRGGVYLYSIEANGVTTQTKRLIIVK